MWLKRPVFVLLLLLAGLSSTVTGVHAQRAEDVQKIAAIVNDQIISEYDLQQRMALFFASSGLSPTRETIERMRPEILQALIDEKLQIQEATEYEIIASEDDINRAVGFIAQQNNADMEQFRTLLARAGVSWNSYIDQIYAQIVWDRLVRARFRQTVNVTEEEVDAFMRRYEANLDKPQHRVAEIFLEVDTPAEEAAVYRTALRLVQQIRNGAKFPAVARQFSQAPTAGTGGELGWVTQGELDKELDRVIRGLRVGNVSDPIRTVAGFYILTVIDRRDPSKVDPNRITLRVKQVSMMISEGDGRKEEAVLESIRSKINKCGDVEPLAEQNGADAVDIGEVALGDLTSDLRGELMDVEKGQSTRVTIKADTLRFVYVCDRDDNKRTMPTRDQVDQRLAGEQIGRMARRYLRDLRRDATIEYR